MDGFADLSPNVQKMIRRKKNVKKGIQFCLMVCGASGTGKSTTPHHTHPILHIFSFIDFHRNATKKIICQAIANVLSLSLSAGRTTFVNTLCNKDVLTHKNADDPTDAHVEDGVKIKPVTVGTLLPVHFPIQTTRI